MPSIFPVISEIFKKITCETELYLQTIKPSGNLIVMILLNYNSLILIFLNRVSPP